MRVIYEPKGKAAEYAPLACNFWTTCPGKCYYCYCPRILHKKKEEFHQESEPKEGLQFNIVRDCVELKRDKREIHLNFIGDPYVPEDNNITSIILDIFELYGKKIQILTKGGMKAERDFKQMKRCGWKFGVSCVWSNEQTRQQFEPNTACLYERALSLQKAHEMGIYTWVSLEPVIDPRQAVNVIEYLNPWVDHWKIGKINYDKALEGDTDWRAFVVAAKKALEGKDYYIKESLRRYE
jgi:DNA repair photolyase